VFLLEERIAGNNFSFFIPLTGRINAKIEYTRIFDVSNKPSRNTNIIEKRYKISRYAWILETYICSGMVHCKGSWRVLQGFQAWEAAQRG